MKTTDYLKRILETQTFPDDAPELKELRQRRAEIERLLRAQFSKSGPSVCWAGSMAKGTMIRESYDGDITCYFAHDEEHAGKTLEEIYNRVRETLEDNYSVEQKASALRVRAKADWRTDLHIDVVPGRYTGPEKSDVFLHRTTGDKARLKTNPQTHIDHIRDSGVVDAIRLMKLWKVRNGLQSAKTFVLELLVVKLLESKKASGLPAQLEYVWTEFRDHSGTLSVDDPANANNDLKPALDACRHLLVTVASNTLWQIQNNGWEAVFGSIDHGAADNADVRKDALRVAAVQVANPTRPWLSSE